MEIEGTTWQKEGLADPAAPGRVEGVKYDWGMICPRGPIPCCFPGLDKPIADLFRHTRAQATSTLPLLPPRHPTCCSSSPEASRTVPSFTVYLSVVPISVTRCTVLYTFQSFYFHIYISLPFFYLSILSLYSSSSLAKVYPTASSSIFTYTYTHTTCRNPRACPSPRTRPSPRCAP